MVSTGNSSLHVNPSTNPSTGSRAATAQRTDAIISVDSSRYALDASYASDINARMAGTVDASVSLDQWSFTAPSKNDAALTPAVRTHEPLPPRPAPTASAQPRRRKPVPTQTTPLAVTKELPAAKGHVDVLPPTPPSLQTSPLSGPPSSRPTLPSQPTPPTASSQLAEAPRVNEPANDVAPIALAPQHEVYAHRLVETLTGINWLQSLTSAHQTSFLAARIAGATRAKNADEYLAEQKLAWGFRPADLEVNALFERAMANANPAGDNVRLQGLHSAVTIACDFLHQAIVGLRDAGQSQDAIDACLHGLGRLSRFSESRSEQVTAHELMYWLINIPGFTGALHIGLQANIDNPAAARVTLSLAHKRMVEIATAELIRIADIRGTNLREINDNAAFILSATSDALLQPRLIPASWHSARKRAADVILKARPAFRTPAAADISGSEDRRSIANLIGLLDDEKNEAAGPYVERLVETYGRALTQTEKQYCAAYYAVHGRPQDALALVTDALTLPKLFAMTALDQYAAVADLCTPQVVARYPLLAMFRVNGEHADSRMMVVYGRVAMLALSDDAGAEAGEAAAARGVIGQLVQRIEPSVQQACLDQLHRESWARPTTSEEAALRYLLAYVECGGDEIAATHLAKIPPRAATVHGKAKANSVQPAPPQIQTARPLSAARKAWFRENLEKPFLQHTTAWYGDTTADHLNATTQFYKGMANRQTRALRAEAEMKLAEETGLVSMLARSDFKNPQWPTYSEHMSRLGLTKQRYEQTTRHIESLRLRAKNKGLFGGASNDAVPAVTAFVNAENKRLASENIGAFWRFLTYMTTGYVYELVLVDVQAYRAQRRAVEG